MKIKKSFWEKKIELQLSRFKGLNNKDINHILEIVDDISTSIGFIGSFISILFGIILIIIKESIEKKMFLVISMESFVLLLLTVIYLSVLGKLFFMKKVLLSQECKVPGLRKHSYASLFNYLLCIGYVITIAIVIRSNCQMHILG